MKNSQSFCEKSYDIAVPPAGSMIEALRAVGYTTQTAIADLIDNSISAGARNIWINFWWEGQNSFISILDDGCGMTEDGLKKAMCLGNRNPLDERSPEDLGRFGLGLKTASFSQCRNLTVASIINHHRAVRRWDLNHVVHSNEWQLLKDLLPESEKRIQPLKKLTHGTIVLWECMDRITSKTSSDDEKAHKNFLNLIERVGQHISMVFHRFLEGPTPEVKIYINGDSDKQRVKAWDTFLMDHPSTIMTPTELIATPAGVVEMQGYILPHKDRLDEKNFSLGSGPEGWTAQQGFYVYRNQRMLVPGSWLGLGDTRRWTKEEPYKLARIRLDIPNSADTEWQIDVRKSMARPPGYLRSRLRDLAEQVRSDARRVFAYRGAYGKRASVKNFQRAWEVIEKKDRICYRINRNHPAVASLLNDFNELRPQIETMLKIIEETVPVQQIWLDTVDQGEVQSEAFGSASEEDVKKVLYPMYCYMLQDQHMTSDEARRYLLRTDPFQNFSQLVMELPDNIEGTNKYEV